jgi:hypothetical protein
MLVLSDGSVGLLSVQADAAITMLAEIKLISLLGITIRCSSDDIVSSLHGLASIALELQHGADSQSSGGQVGLLRAVGAKSLRTKGEPGLS